MNHGISIALFGVGGVALAALWRAYLRALNPQIPIVYNAYKMGVVSERAFLNSIPRSFIIQAKAARWMAVASWLAIVGGGGYGGYQWYFAKPTAGTDTAPSRPITASDLVALTLRHLVPQEPRVQRTDLVITGKEPAEHLLLRVSGVKSAKNLSSAFGKPTSILKDTLESDLDMPRHTEIRQYVAEGGAALRVFINEDFIVGARLVLPVGGEALAAKKLLGEEPPKVAGAGAQTQAAAPPPKKEMTEPGTASSKPATALSTAPPVPLPPKPPQAEQAPKKLVLESLDGRKKAFTILVVATSAVKVQDEGGQVFEIPFDKLSPESVRMVKSGGVPAVAQTAQTPIREANNLIPAIWDKTKPPETWDKTTTAWLHFRIEAGEQEIEKSEIQRKFDETQEKLKLSQRSEDRQRRVKESLNDLAASIASGDFSSKTLVPSQLQYAYFEWSEDKKSVEVALPIEKAYCNSWPAVDKKVHLTCQDMLPLSFGVALSGQQHNAGDGLIVSDITLDGELQDDGTVRGKLSGMLVFKNQRFSVLSTGAPVLREVPFVLSRVR